MTIDINAFGGMVPRLQDAYLAPNQASVANNTYLTGGTLKPWRQRKFITTLAKSGALKTIFLYGKGTAIERWCHWNEEVDVRRTAVAGDTTLRAYFTGTDAPREFNNVLVDIGGNDQYPEDSYLLGIPKPTNAPTVATVGGGSGPQITRNYVYTFVSEWGEEGPPSPPSANIVWQSGQSINLTNLSTAPAGDYNITKKRIYRVVTTIAGALYLFVKEIDIVDTSTNDAVQDDALGEALPSTEWFGPTTGMKHLIVLPNGVYAGATDETVYISERYLPYAYPYTKSIPAKIVGLSNLGNNIIVCTEQGPHIIYCEYPEQAYTAGFESATYPCVSKRSIVTTPYGVFYASSIGMIRVTLAGVVNITEKVMTRDEWELYKPSTIHGCFYDDRYIGFYSTGPIAGVNYGSGFCFSPTDDISLWSDIDFYVDACHVDERGNMYVCFWDGQQNFLYQWHGDGDFVGYQWKSKDFIGRPRLYSAIKVDFDTSQTQDEIDAYNAQRQSQIDTNTTLLASPQKLLGPLGSFYCAQTGVVVGGSNLIEVLPDTAETPSVTVKLWGDNVLIHQATISDERPIRVPMSKRFQTYNVELIGKSKINRVQVAPTITELAR